MKFNASQLNRKRIMIGKANTMIFIVVAVTSVIAVFSMFISKNLIVKHNYQQRVIKERDKSLKKLKENVSASKSLVEAYKTFDASPESFIGTADNNSRLTLDALPSKYDFPALTASLEKILSTGGYQIESITGVDNEISAEQESPKPLPLSVPFSVTTRGGYDSIQKLVTDFEHSIRPIKIKKLEIAGSDSSVRATIDAETYYQPERKLEIQTKVVK
jgi:Tfp pilus assembly protein PilO